MNSYGRLQYDTDCWKMCQVSVFHIETSAYIENQCYPISFYIYINMSVIENEATTFSHNLMADNNTKH